MIVIVALHSLSVHTLHLVALGLQRFHPLLQLGPPASFIQDHFLVVRSLRELGELRLQEDLRPIVRRFFEIIDAFPASAQR